MKFTPQGGRVELGPFRRGDEAVVQVRDTGPGIAAEECERVGRRFYRSDKSRRLVWSMPSSNCTDFDSRSRPAPAVSRRSPVREQSPEGTRWADESLREIEATYLEELGGVESF